MLRFLCAVVLLCLAACSPAPKGPDSGETVTAPSRMPAAQTSYTPAPALSKPPQAPSGPSAASPVSPSMTAPSVSIPETSATPADADTPPSSPEPSPSGPTPRESPQETAETVTVRIEGPDGWLIEDANVEFTDGLTAADAIAAACEDAGVELVVRGSGKLTYIESIGGCAEKSEGALSGWIFKINGEQSSVGAGASALSAGDRVSVYFSLDMGGDVKDKE